ncbi:permease [Candidatus Peregrinibacteria bacterium]|nr:permease [Candidatus Peregrinibacteria bacterium]
MTNSALSAHRPAGATHEHGENHEHGAHAQVRRDYFLWGTSAVLIATYASYFLLPSVALATPALTTFSESIVELIHTIWWSLLVGMIFVGVLGQVPREMVISAMGRSGTVSGMLRAVFAGVLLDLCSHGILFVGSKLYERGVSVGQVVAFLIASPWNSIVLTLLLWQLVGFQWMLVFVLLSMTVGLIAGLLFDMFVRRKILPPNPNAISIPPTYSFWKEAKDGLRHFRPSRAWTKSVAKTGLLESRLIMRWIFFGIILAALVRAIIPTEMFGTLFGPTLAGLGLTIIVATILEVCSEGSMPVATDILTRAGAAGNSFAFLMTGVSTDYTEILILRETTKSWKIPLFLPLVTVPQVVLLGWLLNQFPVT